MILLFSFLMTTTMMMTNKDIKTAHEMCPRNGFINGTAHASAKRAAVGRGRGGGMEMELGLSPHMPRIQICYDGFYALATNEYVRAYAFTFTVAFILALSILASFDC